MHRRFVFCSRRRSGVNIDLNKRDWTFLRPRSIVAQASDGAIYFTETGNKMFSVLRAI